MFYVFMACYKLSKYILHDLSLTCPTYIFLHKPLLFINACVLPHNVES